MHRFLLPVFFAIAAMVAPFMAASLAAETDIAGKVQFEWRSYGDTGQFANQDYRSQFSVALQPEFYREWNNGDESLTFTPFVRIDEHDDERSHGDIRELFWTRVNGNWEFHTGVRKVFWGVTEFNHLVDVINQTDSVDALDGEEKLGQPMFNASRVGDWGIVDFFILPGFRERTFAGPSGRFRSGSLVNEDAAHYESSDEEKHIDYAMRWSHSVDVFDFGVYVFDGTDRDPILQAGANSTLIPYYQQVTQTGIDLQATIDSWLWKLEVLHKHSRLDDYFATQAGFEYTFYGLGGSTKDLGVLLEYGWDERGVAGSTAQNDLYLGFRLVFNGANDTEVLAGFAYDADFHSHGFLVEASRRLNDYWTLSVESQLFHVNNANDPVASLANDDYIQLVLERHF